MKLPPPTLLALIIPLLLLIGNTETVELNTRTKSGYAKTDLARKGIDVKQWIKK